MPLSLLLNPTPETTLGLWEITETNNFFVQALNTAVLPKEKLEKRQLEKLAVRHLLNTLASEQVHGKIDYDHFGKPHIIDNQFYISFSHKNPYAAVIVSTLNANTGIDIERVGPMPLKLSAKFTNSCDLNAKDLDLNEEQRCALIWSAKECLYKVYGKKELDFRQHMTIVALRKGALVGKIHKHTLNLHVELNYLFFNDMVVVYTS